MLIVSFLEGSGTVSDLFDVGFWVWLLIAYHVFWAIMLYFGILNRRRFVGLLGWPSQKVSLRYVGVLTLFVLFIFGWLGGFMAIGIHTGQMGGLIFGAAMLGWLLILFVAFYFFFCRGIAIHKNGTIRVFQIKITTIRDGKIERIETEARGKKTTLYVYIGGQRFSFNLATDMSDMLCKRLSDTVKELEEFAFDHDVI